MTLKELEKENNSSVKNEMKIYNIIILFINFSKNINIK